MKSIAAVVAVAKRDHPDRYCSAPNCLWRVQTRHGSSPCPKHPKPEPTPSNDRQNDD